ncbi:MAG TPA: hypothetical protein QF469_02485 [Sphingomonas sanguinis]|uniref:hypothetical protein n=1 Tax=Sphingomonas sanguinis TaxID=33051 RepID=UPI002AC2A14A|nr:hypothetical protein [Sphingomonas sanguinis]
MAVLHDQRVEQGERFGSESLGLAFPFLAPLFHPIGKSVEMWDRTDAQSDELWKVCIGTVGDDGWLTGAGLAKRHAGTTESGVWPRHLVDWVDDEPV